MNRERGHESGRQRVFGIARRLLTDSDELDVFELADDLFIAPATLEADLGRVREIFREHGLVLRRSRDLVKVEGTERRQRRLLRQLVLSSAEGLSATAVNAFSGQFAEYDLAELRATLLAAARESGLEINEYSMNDLLIHLVIAVDRLRTGRSYDAEENHSPANAASRASLAGVVVAVERFFGIAFPMAEREALQLLLSTRVAPSREPGSPLNILEDSVLSIVTDCLESLWSRYGLTFTDDRARLSLALHVQGVRARAASDRQFDNPLGQEFRNAHPLVHEIALSFARQLEHELSIRLDPGEVDLLSLHLGSQFQKQLNEGPPVLVSCVFPRYGGLEVDARDRLAVALGTDAVIEQLITTPGHDFDTITSDLIVTSIDLAGRTRVPVVKVSPLLGTEDIEAVRSELREQRRRATRRRLQADLVTLSDPRLFFHPTSAGRKEDVLRVMSTAMIEAGVVQPTFLDDVLDRESRSPTAFGGQFAFPHSMYPDAEESAIAVLVSDEPVDWGNSSVRLVAMLAMSPDAGTMLRDFLDHFTELLLDASKIASLIERSVDYPGFLAAVNELLAD
ncbi:BglG family transcription antiterminator [Propionicimonas paludicola]|uniref:BglG family transcription antiterminator n=1 Tax=Propionicimonas paludicola TaxID=185243 RepID=UPI001FE656E1|nr:PTS sugar transporter subunit IIA [Propionicimonas paludicola]